MAGDRGEPGARRASPAWPSAALAHPRAQPPGAPRLRGAGRRPGVAGLRRPVCFRFILTVDNRTADRLPAGRARRAPARSPDAAARAPERADARSGTGRTPTDVSTGHRPDAGVDP